MKFFERFLLIIFSILVIVLSISLVLYSTDMIDISHILNMANNWILNNKIVIVIVGTIFALFGLIGLFSSTYNPDNTKPGLALKGDKGTVYMTRETFDNIILAVTRNYAELRNVKVETDISEEGITCTVYASILPDTVVPSLTSKLQENIKATILKQTTIEIKEANIKIRGVYLEPQKK